MSNRLIQNIFSVYKNQLDASPQSLKNRKAIHAITHCRTREMGVSYYSCSENHQGVEQFHSCRNRSCFLCAQKKRQEWIESQKQRLFNTPHFHVIFTLPHEYLPLWRFNEGLFTNIIFKASQSTLLELLADTQYGGVTPGILMSLHTWGRQLTLHPHTHCLVTAGGLDPQGEWKSLGKFLLPGGVIRRVYRGKIQALLRDALESGDLVLPPDMRLSMFWATYRSLYKKDWSVRIEERYEHGKGVLLYLARYCKGGPVSPRQICAATHQYIELSYLDHRDKRTKLLKLSPREFLRRMLEHVPATGVHTVRHYGLYASACREKHRRCTHLHGTLQHQSHAASATYITMLIYCKSCGRPSMLRYQAWPTREKGNSINKAQSQHCSGGHVQQGDEDGHAHMQGSRESCYSTG